MRTSWIKTVELFDRRGRNNRKMVVTGETGWKLGGSSKYRASQSRRSGGLGNNSPELIDTLVSLGRCLNWLVGRA